MSRRKNLVAVIPDKETRADLFRQKSQEPFVAVLDRLLGAEPTQQRLREWAHDRPDLWTGAVRNIAHLAGYSERSEVHHTGILGHIHAMSDAELLHELEAARKTYDGEASVVCENRIGVSPQTGVHSDSRLDGDEAGE